MFLIGWTSFHQAQLSLRLDIYDVILCSCNIILWTSVIENNLKGRYASWINFYAMILSHFLIALRVMIIAPLKIYGLLVLSFRVHFACVFINGGQQLKKKRPWSHSHSWLQQLILTCPGKTGVFLYHYRNECTFSLRNSIDLPSYIIG